MTDSAATLSALAKVVFLLRDKTDAQEEQRSAFRAFAQGLGGRDLGVTLTERENEVLLRVAKGFTLPEIGVQLGLSRHTIADYVKQIYRKLNVSSRAEAALEAQRLGLFRR